MGRISFSTELDPAIGDADLMFLAVGRPMRRRDGHADLSFVFQAVEELAPHLRGFTMIATKSTVPERAARSSGASDCSALMLTSRSARTLNSCARVQPSTISRIPTACSWAAMPSVRGRSSERLYKPLTLRNAPVLFGSRESAELAKYASNTFLAMKISFINEIADLCEAAGADVQEVATAVGADGRIGNKFLHPGPRYGGSCFPKDVAVLIRTAREERSPLSLIEQVQTVNSERKIAMAGRVECAAGGSLAGKTVAVLGIAFKPDTGDVRESPSLILILTLRERGPGFVLMIRMRGRIPNRFSQESSGARARS
jgi:UDPglucose 6-dehydrogenase